MPVILRRLWIQLTADRRRFGMFCAMILVGLLLWSRIIVTSNVPRTAVAEDEVAISDAHSPTGENMINATDNRRRTPVNVELAESPIRDPFLINDEYFPKPTSPDVLPQDQAKLLQRPAEVSGEPEALVATQLRALVSRFTLEAVMKGRPMAIISGRTYQLGDWIPAVDNEAVRFRLDEVRERSVVLECKDHRFELKMESPEVLDRES